MALGRLSVVLFALVLFLGVAPDARAGGTIVTSGDGVALTLGGDGSVAGVRLGSRSLGRTGQGGFSLRTTGGTPNLIPNAGFERDVNGDGVPDGWTLVRTGPLPTLVSSPVHSWSRAVRLGRTSTGNTGKFRVRIPVRPGVAYSLSAWMRSDHLAPSGARAITPGFAPPGRLSIEEVTDSTQRWIDNLFSYTDTEPWHHRSIAIRTGPAATALQLSLKIVGGRGTLWFDDLALREVLSPSSTAVAGTVTSTGDNEAHQVASIAGGLRLDATFRGAADRITVDGSIRSTTNADRPIELSYTLPINATGWRWHDNARNSTVIQSGRTYSYETLLNVQTMSRYPWNTLSDPRSSISIGIPLDKPRIERVRYGPSGLTISFDLGLSPRATGLGAAATFTFVIFTSTPAWGFRAATEHYYDMFPQFFTRRTVASREGGWGIRAGAGVWADRIKDFGIGLDMLPLGADHIGTSHPAIVAADNAEGLYASAYNHHWGYKQPQEAVDTIPSYASAVATLRTDAAGPRETLRQRALADRSAAALKSTATDENGQYIYEGYVYAVLYLQWYQDLDPLQGSIDWASVSRVYQTDAAIDAEAGAGGQLDGIHMDSTSGMRRWGAADDYTKAHWAAATQPLTFSYESLKVVKRGLFSDYGELVRTADYVHSKDMIMSANTNGSEARAGSWFGANVIDYFGIERGLIERAAVEPYQTVDSLALFKRSMADQRPVSSYDQLVSAGGISNANVERRIQLNLFYGIYAGIGAGDHLTEGIRHLYLRYTPLFRAINEVGWEPVTRGRTNYSDVWIERFGAIEDGIQYFTLRNEGSQPRDVRVTFGLTGSGVQVSDLTARELVGDKPVAVEAADNGGGIVRLSVAPGKTRVVRITDTSSAP